MVTDELLKTLRDFILEQMDSRKMSTHEFADFVGVAQTTIVRATNFKNSSDPSLEFLAKLSRATETDICTLVALVKPEETLIRPEARLLAQRIEQLPTEQREMVDTFLLGIFTKRSKK